MLEQFRSIRLGVAVVIAAVTSAVLYWNHINRAVGDGDLCRRVEKHVVKLNTDAGGAVISDADGIVDNILTQCERHFSKGQAKCVLKASSMIDVRACK
jgi:hypothetical protein